MPDPRVTAAPVAPLVTAGADAAESAGLHYVSDHMPGIRRVRRGRGFRYLAPDGTVVRESAELRRIRSLVIPPAWTEVWICVSPRGHIQAIGRDARRRKQYRYHARWREIRDETKYDQLIEFARALPALRRRVRRDLARRGMPREKVLATVARLLEATMMRIGNPEYARANRSFGLSTLRDRHVNVSGHTLAFQFRGKSGKLHAVRVVDRRLANVIRACHDIPGYELFQYLDAEGQPRAIDSSDVNAYLREITGSDVTAKLFRTWAGTVQAMTALKALPARASEAEARRDQVEVVRQVAKQLGNTPAVCRKCYIHPAVLEAHRRGALALRSSRSRLTGLDADENATLAFLIAWKRARAAGASAARRHRAGGPRGVNAGGDASSRPAPSRARARRAARTGS